MVQQKFKNNKKSIFCLSHIFWGDTKLVFWESIGRSDCTSFSRIGLKISQMANLFVFIFLQKRVSEALTSLFVLFFERLISQTKNFYEICSKFLEFQKINLFFGENFWFCVWDERIRRKKVTFTQQMSFPTDSVKNHSICLQN